MNELTTLRLQLLQAKSEVARIEQLIEVLEAQDDSALVPLPQESVPSGRIAPSSIPINLDRSFIALRPSSDGIVYDSNSIVAKLICGKYFTSSFKRNLIRLAFKSANLSAVLNIITIVALTYKIPSSYSLLCLYSLVTLIPAIMLLNVDVIKKLFKQFEFWYLSLTCLIYFISFSILIGPDPRLSYVFLTFVWFSFTNFMDALPSREFTVKLLTLGNIFIILTLQILILFNWISFEDVDVHLFSKFKLSVATLVVNSLNTLLIFNIRGLLVLHIYPHAMVMLSTRLKKIIL